MTGLLGQSLQVAVGLLLLIAGAAKFLELAATPPYPQPWSSLVRRVLSTRHGTFALSVIEMGVGSALVLGPSARAVTAWAAIAAAALFASYSVWLAVKLRKGKGESCNCFGRIARSTVNGFTLGRNVLLVVASTWLAVSAESRAHPQTYSVAIGFSFAVATIWLTHIASARSAPGDEGAAGRAADETAVALPIPALVAASEEGS